MKVQLRVFVDWNQNNWPRLLPQAEFAYNNVINTSTCHSRFKFNYSYHSKVSFKENVDSRLRFRSANKLVEELKDLMEVCCQNLLHVQELQKRAYNKGVESRNFAPDKKIWLNRKYIKIKRNKKLENKFIGSFRVLHIVEKQTYKIELPTKYKIHNLSYVSLLKWQMIKKRRVGNLSESEKEFELGDNKKYKVKAIVNSIVYDQQANS